MLVVKDILRGEKERMFGGQKYNKINNNSENFRGSNIGAGGGEGFA